MVAVEVDGGKTVGAGETTLDPVWTEADLGAHSCQRLGEADVALDAVAADAFDPHRAVADGAGGKEIRGRRGVALDLDMAGALVGGGGHDEARPAVALDLDAKAPHQIQGDLNIGFGDQLALDLYRHRPPQQGRREQ